MTIEGVKFNLDNRSDLRKLFGQIFLIGLDGNAYNDENLSKWEKQFQSLNIGGVFFERRNFINSKSKPISISQLLRKIELSKEMEIDKASLPRFITLDHEGGATSQLMKYQLATQLPAQMGIASLRNIKALEKMADISSSELSALGFNMNLGPVVDLNTESKNYDIRDRSFGDEPQDVIRFASSYIDISNKHGLLSVIKHFPGHGHTQPGFDTPGVAISKHRPDTINASMRPFRELIKFSPAVMTSHMKIEALDIDNVTTDKRMVGQLLRSSSSIKFNGKKLKGLGFDGLIIADSLNEISFTAIEGECEKNINGYVSALKNNSLKAFDAGHDILMFSHVFESEDKSSQEKRNPSNQWCARWAITLDEFEEIYQYIEDSIFNESGDDSLHLERINRLKSSIKRILKAKNNFVYKATKATASSYSQLMKRNSACGKKLVTDAITYLMVESEDKSHYLSNIRKSDRVILFSFVADGMDKNISNKELNRLWFRYHRNLVKHIKKKTSNLKVVQMKISPQADEMKVLDNKIVSTISDSGQKPSHIIFLVDFWYKPWEVVRHFFTRNIKEKLHDPKFMYTIVTRNPGILNTFSTPKSANAEDTNIIVVYSAYEKGSDHQMQTIFEYQGEGDVSKLPIKVDRWSPINHKIKDQNYTCN